MNRTWNSRQGLNTCGFKPNQILNDPDRFHAIYFIDNITGSVLISNKYSNFSAKNEDLISGFLSAMNMFVQELQEDQTEEIQEINFQGSRILYERKGRLLCIGFTKKTDLQSERTILKRVINDFYFRFKEEIKNFNGYIDPAMIEYKDKLKGLNLNELCNPHRL